MIRNQKGLMTIDFIFALVMAMGFFAIIFSLSLTLSVVEITQYATFATARIYSAAHINQQKQAELASKKYKSLLADNATLASFFKQGNWFDLDPNPKDEITNFDFNKEYPPPSGANDFSSGGIPFTGMRVNLKIKMLSFNIPFLGRTFDEEGASTYVASFLLREPTLEECWDFTKDRFRTIKELDGRFKNGSINDTKYAAMADDGC